MSWAAVSLPCPPRSPHLQRGEAVVLQEGQARDGDQQELQAEGVVLAVKRLPKSHVDHVDGDVGAYQKNDLGEGRKVKRARSPHQRSERDNCQGSCCRRTPSLDSLPLVLLLLG